MKKILITLIALTSLNSCKQMTTQPIAETENFLNLSFTDREWKIKSIVTEPALIDIDGDDKLDAEIINSLQEKERNKRIIFTSTGEVIEKIAKDNSAFEFEIVKNGSWSKQDGSTGFKWVQEDKTVCLIDARNSESDELRIMSTDNNDIKVVIGLVAGLKQINEEISGK